MSLQDEMKSGFDSGIDYLRAQESEGDARAAAEERELLKAEARNYAKLKLLSHIKTWLHDSGIKLGLDSLDPWDRSAFKRTRFTFAVESIDGGAVVLEFDGYGDWYVRIADKQSGASIGLSIDTIKGLRNLEKLDIERIAFALGRYAALKDKPLPEIDFGQSDSRPASIQDS